MQALNHAWTATMTNGQPALYVFNRGENEGWVIIAADDHAYTVLGYSNQGHWDKKALPANAMEWIETYCGQIEQVSSTEPASYHAPASRQAYTPVAPMCTTLWGQGTPYNNLCPIDADGNRCVTGCAATATSQIMRKHRHPAQGTGSHSYEWTDSDKQTHTLSVDFSQTTYDWGHMIVDYNALPATDEQQSAVATLMYHCGVAAEIAYSSTNSGANSRKMVNALIDHFGYDKGVRALLKDYMQEDSIMQAVAADLSAGRPVYISAATVKNEGHAFVCDGIDADGLLSINWGWNGKSNGYFRLSAFNPKEQGTGGSKTNRGYTERVILYTHIQPAAENVYYHTLTCENIRLEKTRYGRDEKVQIEVDTLKNCGFGDWEGNLRLLIYKDGKYYRSRTINDDKSPLGSYYYWKKLGYNASFANTETYPNGEYEIVMAARATDQPEKTFPVHRKWMGEWRCKMTLTDDSIYLTAPEVHVPEYEVVNPAEYTFTLLDAYYYPSSSTDSRHRWKLQLATADFYSKDPDADPDQMLLLFNVYSNSAQSILGNHTADKNDTYRCLSATQYYGIGADEENMVTLDANEGACTLVYNQSTNSYTVRYRIQLYHKDYTGMAEVPVTKIRAYYGEAYGSHKKGDRITLQHQVSEGIEDVQGDKVQCTKVIRDGQVLIIRNGETYTLRGEKVGGSR